MTFDISILYVSIHSNSVYYVRLHQILICLYCYTITIFDTMYSEVEQIGINVNNVIKELMKQGGQEATRRGEQKKEKGESARLFVCVSAIPLSSLMTEAPSL